MDEPVQGPLRQRPLRRRLFFAMCGLAVGTLLLASLSFFFFNQYLEDMMLEIIMSQEVSVIKEHLDANPDSPLPRASSMRVYRGDDLPVQLRGLAAGRHHDIRIDGDRYDVMVDEWDGRPLYLLFNINRMEGLERLLFGMLAVLTLLLTWLAAASSLLLARRLADPVDRLAARLAELQPTSRNIQLAAEFEGEDVERIARAVDRYIERIEGFIEREQAFTSAASHELRTPLSVIQGATELLIGNAEKPGDLRALARIERARRDMLEFIDALLSLSREELGAADYRSDAHVDQVLRQLCREVEESLADRPVRLVCGEPADIRVNAPPTLLAIALSNLLRNAVGHTRQGEIRVGMEEGAVVIEDTGEGISADIADTVFDPHVSGGNGNGLGLHIVKRICDRFGWSIRLEPAQDGGTRAVLRFE